MVLSCLELRNCRRHCYPNVSDERLLKRYRICGGVALYVFGSFSVENVVEEALADYDAVKEVCNIRKPTKILPTTHTLLHTIVTNDGQYKLRHVDIASKYLGEQLWTRHSPQMLTNLQEMFGYSPTTEISRHLFEIYGHLVFSVGGRTLNCRCLETGAVTKLTLDTLGSKQRMTFGKDTLPTAENLSGHYYEPTDDDSFPAIDSLSAQGMFEFTVAAEHPIREAQILQKLCKLYKEPKLFFVVPPHRFKDFKKQSFKAETGLNDAIQISELKQYVLELAVTTLIP